MNQWSILVLIALCCVKVKCISLKGPGTTWYNPCGLGVIHFDKYTSRNWLGVVHFGLYKHLQVAVMEIKFEKKVRIYWASHNSTVTPMDSQGREYIISPEGFLPEQYKFYLELEELTENDTDVPIVTKFTLNNLVLCDEGIRVSQTVESLSTLDDRHVCGRRSLDHSELVSIRTDAEAGNWPWHVAILTRNPVTNKTSHYCGGNIISRTAVLTAGPCIRRKGATIPKEWITVVAGIVNLRDPGQIGKQILPVTEVVLHPNYDDESATSALAVLKVDRFNFTAFVQPVCLWGPIYDKTSLFGKLGMFVGFGDNERDNPSYALRSTDILVQNDTTCLTHSSMYGKLINELTICAGTTTGLRPGDGGGGLVLPVMQSDHRMSWFLRGILSKCILTSDQSECDPSFYVVYTDVGPHFSWIYHHSGL